MCEVTDVNFEEYFPQIEESIKNADFIAIDSEFSGLKVNESSSKPSLFDTGADRYKKLLHNTKCFIPCQIGIAAFRKLKNSIRYETQVFNFYIFPKSFGKVDVRFLCQASSLHFLCQHNFDFNKFVYNGVSYMNQVQESELRQQLKTKQLFQGIDREVDEKALLECCSKVASWLIEAQDGDSLTLDKINSIRTYILHNELRQRFGNVWTSNHGKQVIVKKVNEEMKQQCEKSNPESQSEMIIKEMLGFTRVFRLLVDSKKPVVAHNCLTDFLLFYDKFYNPLPEKYSTFKQNITGLFPVIFDTKHIAAQMRREFDDTGFLESTGLETLYNSLNSYKAKYQVLYSPEIAHSPGFSRYSDLHCPHEAGFDAYMAGYVFLRLGHMLFNQNFKNGLLKPVEFRQYMTNMGPFINCINLIRGVSDHLKLDGIDPVTRRPQWLFVRSKPFTEPLDTIQLAQWFAPYGSVDVKLGGNRKAYVAVGNHGCAKDILRAFRQHDKIEVVKYSVWRHSSIVRAALWTGVFVSGGLCLWALLDRLDKPPAN